MVEWIEDQEELAKRIKIQLKRSEYRSTEFWELEQKILEAEYGARSVMHWVEELDRYPMKWREMTVEREMGRKVL